MMVMMTGHQLIHFAFRSRTRVGAKDVASSRLTRSVLSERWSQAHSLCLFRPELGSGPTGTEMERCMRPNRVAGRLDLPAPTPPDMRLRVRRFLAVPKD